MTESHGVLAGENMLIRDPGQRDMVKHVGFRWTDPDTSWFFHLTRVALSKLGYLTTPWVLQL